MDEAERRSAVDDAAEVAQDIGKAKRLYRGVKNAKAAANTAKAAKAVGGAVKAIAAQVAGAIGAIGLPVILGVLFLFLVVYIFVYPFNVVKYEVDATGDRITDTSPRVGRDLSTDGMYDSLMGWYEFTSAMEDFAFHFLHPNQAAAADDIMQMLGDKGITLVEDDLGQEYFDGSNSLITTMDGAFRKGWARTLATAEYRAGLVKAKSTPFSNKMTVVDEYDGEEMWNSDTFWASESNWKSHSDDYIAGTHTDSGVLRGQYTGPQVSITTSIEPDPSIKEPVYLDAIIKIIAMQNSAELSILGDIGNMTQFGIDTPYTDDAISGDADATKEEKINSTEYQLLRLAGEVAGRGILTGDLNTVKEQNSIYQIITQTTILPTVHHQNVEREVLDHYETKETYQLDEHGDKIWDSINETYLTTTTSEPVYKWVHDHYDVYVTVAVKTTYKIILRNNTKDLIMLHMTEGYSSEERTAFNTAMDDYYAMQYESLCTAYNVVPYAWDYGGADGLGGYASGLTPEEVEALLSAIAVDPASARGKIVAAALGACGRFSYSQSNGFRRGVQMGIYTPGNANYTGSTHDCSSFVQWCYFQAGVPLSPTNTFNYNSAIASGELVQISISDVQPGDLQVVPPGSGYEGHVWMYVGNNVWCECTPGKGVTASNWSWNFMMQQHLAQSKFVKSKYL